jgi:hypothetical protein
MQQQTKILEILESEQIEPSTNAQAMCEKIMVRHQGRVQALIYYGSSLRAMNDPAKMLDFYVLVDSYKKTHRSPIRRALNALIPPAVYYLENENPDGSVSNCKYSIISLDAFEKKSGEKALLSQIWGRFSQPCVLLFPKDETIRNRVQTARVNAIEYMAAQTIPLVEGSATATRFWAKGFMESYKTELRPESSSSRSEEIVNRYLDRYNAISAQLFGRANKNGQYDIPISSVAKRKACKRKWAWRRFVGKPATAIRVLNSAFTFDGGLDYVLHKLKSHSGETITVSESQRRHPILWSPVLGWKLYRKGAFK